MGAQWATVRPQSARERVFRQWHNLFLWYAFSNGAPCFLPGESLRVYVGEQLQQHDSKT